MDHLVLVLSTFPPPPNAKSGYHRRHGQEGQRPRFGHRRNAAPRGRQATDRRPGKGGIEEERAARAHGQVRPGGYGVGSGRDQRAGVHQCAARVVVAAAEDQLAGKVDCRRSKKWVVSWEPRETVDLTRKSGKRSAEHVFCGQVDWGLWAEMFSAREVSTSRITAESATCLST